MNLYTRNQVLLAAATVFCISLQLSDGLHISRLEVTSLQGICPLDILCEVTLLPETESVVSGNWTLNGDVRDTFQSQLLESSSEQTMSYSLVIPCETSSIGNLTCRAGSGEEEASDHTIQLSFPVAPKIIAIEGSDVRFGESARLLCQSEAFPPAEIAWTLNGLPLSSLSNKPKVTKEINEYSTTSVVEFSSVERSHNGSFVCTATNNQGGAKRIALLVVKSAPTVQIEGALGISQTQIYLNWTLNSGNYPILRYRVGYLKEGTDQWVFSSNPPPDVSGTSHVVNNLEASTSYRLRIEAENEAGSSPVHEIEQLVQTLDEDPEFIPSPQVKGSTKNSLTLGWTHPLEEIRPYFSHYLVSFSSVNTTETHVNVTSMSGVRTEHLFGNLKPATLYTFRVRTCYRYTDQCGDYSSTVNGSTLDGDPSPPLRLEVACRGGEDGKNYQVVATWEPPSEPNGVIQYYSVRLTGVARFYDESGNEAQELLGPMVQTVDVNKLQFTFDDVQPNTAYTVQISGATKSSLGLPAESHCQTTPALPKREALNQVSWTRVLNKDSWMFQMSVPRLTERNGRICCYAVVMVKIPYSETISHLPEPGNLVLKSYTEVHMQGSGAYVAELVDPDSLSDSILLGDGESQSSGSQRCYQCARSGLTKRSRTDSGEFSLGDSFMDGFLDPSSNYTAFVKVYGHRENHLDSVCSPYVSPLTPKPPEPDDPHDRPVVLIVALGVLCGVACVLLLLVLVLIFLRRYSKNVSESEGVEMSLASTCRHLWRRFHDDRQLLVSVPSMPSNPIMKEDIVRAFLERHQNSDYGFQHEFEVLPERFTDRTTRASDAKENLGKNRYPDIKAYDQTRVRLPVAENSPPCSDYINANFVMGYKERKKFICAQGPMESTVDDFWRMAWEQRVEVIVMLTNVEEYNKTKCYQYWPDLSQDTAVTPEPVYLDPVSSDTPTEETLPKPSNGTLQQTKCNPQILYGDICVLNVKEKRMSEYVIREFQVSRQKSAASSDPELGILEREVRPVFQYHYLAWKDFQAPEHAHGLLRFLRRLNEDYSTDRGPILIHCSAGVGRTGTLVALDHLTQQIEEEGCVSVFNTVYDLRHQRNFLVQSLRQYIFVYRALMEWVQFGDTEISVSDFEEALQRMRLKNDQSKTILDEQFEKLGQIVEDPKPFAVARAEENRSRNRHETAIPYDRNRVILTPVPGRDYSTYINASFIEGFDNSETFVLTQDPLEATARDFWRMVLEHGVSVVVMLSEMGAEPLKCPQYWPDDGQELLFDNVTVKHLSSVSLPALIRREFHVVNTKTLDEARVTQLQLLCWPSSAADVLKDESVPSAHHLGIFVSAAVEALELKSGPVCVHCSSGSVRSSVFAALCILVEQARVEECVDVFSLVRKLRSQRLLMIQFQSHFNFLYDALAFYLKTNPASLPPSP